MAISRANVTKALRVIGSRIKKNPSNIWRMSLRILIGGPILLVYKLSEAAVEWLDDNLPDIL